MWTTFELGNRLRVPVFLLLLAALTGCPAANDRRGVTGTVAVDGAPLELGAISFMPEGELGATSSGATVRDGKFELPADRGLRPGRYRVRVLAYRATGRTHTDPQIGEHPELEELRFEEPDLEAVIVGDGLNHFDFALNEVQ